MPNDKITAVGANIAEKAAMIWNVADMLRGPFKPHEYGLVILPMTVVKRFHDCLLPTHQAVLDTYEKVKKLQVIDGFLQKASGYQFYNTSRFTFETLLADPDNIESNFRDYLSGFSANAQDVLAKFDFDNIIKRMVESNTLYLVIKEFGSEKGYLGPDKISAVDCGYIFEDLVRRFSESFRSVSTGGLIIFHKLPVQIGMIFKCRHLIVQKIIVQRFSRFLIKFQLFGKSESNSHTHASMHLRFRQRRIALGLGPEAKPQAHGK